MKRTLLLSLFLFSFTTSFAQYGRLEVMSPSDTIMVLRTPAESIKQLKEQKDKKVKRIGNCIESVERQLNFVRSGYVVNQIPAMNVQSFLNCVKFLEQNGVDVNYYVQEFFIYFPKEGTRTKRSNQAY